MDTATRTIGRTSQGMRQLLVVAIVVCSTVVAQVAAFDWPQFLGPDRNGTYAGPPLSATWGASGPRAVWRKEVGQGFAGPAVVQGHVLLFHRVGNEEVLESLDAKTGT